MKLRDYLTDNQLSYTDFARRIGVSRVSVMYYATGKKRPRAEVCQKIMEVTKGEVTAHDHHLAWRDRKDRTDEQQAARIST